MGHRVSERCCSRKRSDKEKGRDTASPAQLEMRWEAPALLPAALGVQTPWGPWGKPSSQRCKKSPTALLEALPWLGCCLGGLFQLRDPITPQASLAAALSLAVLSSRCCWGALTPAELRPSQAPRQQRPQGGCQSPRSSHCPAGGGDQSLLGKAAAQHPEHISQISLKGFKAMTKRQFVKSALKAAELLKNSCNVCSAVALGVRAVYVTPVPLCCHQHCWDLLSLSGFSPPALDTKKMHTDKKCQEIPTIQRITASLMGGGNKKERNPSVI